MVETIEWADAQVVAEGLAFPEGPVAMADGSVLVCEIARGALSRVPAGGGSPELVAETGGGPNGAAVGPDGAVYVCNNGMHWARRDGRLVLAEQAPGRIQRVELESGTVTDLYVDCDGRPFLAPNDIVFDAHGGFWFTDFGKARDHGRDHGGIFHATIDGTRVTRVLDDVPDPNGIGLSPDGSVVYWAQTETRIVKRRRLAAPGTLAEAGRSDPFGWLDGLPGTGGLDSMAVEAGGRVCVGMLHPGGIAVFDPDAGFVERHVAPPALREGMVTNICFGGDDGRTAFLTCSTTGRVVSVRWPRPGLGLAFSR